MPHIGRVRYQLGTSGNLPPMERSTRTDPDKTADVIFARLPKVFKLLDISANRNIARRVANVLISRGLAKERNVKHVNGRVVLKFDKVENDPSIHQPV